MRTRAAGVAKAGDRLAPVVPVQVHPALRAGNFFTPLHESRAPGAGDYFVIQFG